MYDLLRHRNNDHSNAVRAGLRRVVARTRCERGQALVEFALVVPILLAVVIGIVYSYLPFMVLPLYATLEKLDETLIEAAADLGCPRGKIFWQVTLPLSAPGVVAGGPQLAAAADEAGVACGVLGGGGEHGLQGAGQLCYGKRHQKAPEARDGL